MERETDRGTYMLKEDENLGAVQIADDVVAMIASLAATEVDGVSALVGNITNDLMAKVGMKKLTKGVKVDVLDGAVSVDLAITIQYGHNIPQTSQAVQNKVKAAIENMTGLSVDDVNIRIAGVQMTEQLGCHRILPKSRKDKQKIGKNKMSRSKLREKTFQLLFRVEFNEREELNAQAELFFADEALENVTEKEKKQIIDKVEAIVSYVTEIDAQIDEKSEGWKTSRIGKVELAILRLAIYEIQYDDSIPNAVAINEAVELAKKYAQEQAPSYINGVLSKFVD